MDTTLKCSDMFVHFDSGSANLNDEGAVDIGVPYNGIAYYISVQNIALEYPDAYAGDGYSAFLGITSSSALQTCGSVKITESIPSRTAIFPLSNPINQNPTSKVYCKLILNSMDSLKVKYYNNTMTEIKNMKRIVATIHISNDPDVIRRTL